MKTILRGTVLIVVVWLQLAGISFGKEVYLRSGETLECQSFWKRGGEVVVKVNRDVVLEFRQSEVDMTRTFHQAKKSAHLKGKQLAARKHRHHAAHPLQTAASTLPAATSPAVAAKGAKATPTAAPQQGGSKPVAAPAQGAAANRQPLQPAATAAAAAAAAKDKAGQKGGAGQSAAQQAASATPQPGSPAKDAPSQKPGSAPAGAPAQGAKDDLQKEAQEVARMKAEAVRKKDPALMNQAIEAEKRLVQRQHAPDALQKGAGQKQGAAAPRKPLPQHKNEPKAPPPITPALAKQLLLLLLVSTLLIIGSLWVIFDKCGEAGWKAIVPLYNMWVLMEVSGKPGWWFALQLIPVVGQIVFLLAMFSLVKRFGRNVLFAVGLFFLPMLFFPLLAVGASRGAPEGDAIA